MLTMHLVVVLGTVQSGISYVRRKGFPKADKKFPARARDWTDIKCSPAIFGDRNSHTNFPDNYFSMVFRRFLQKFEKMQ